MTVVGTTCGVIQVIKVSSINALLFVKADNLYWASVSSAAEGVVAKSLNALQTSQAYRRYEAAKRKAMAKGFMYTPNADLFEYTDITKLVLRMKTLPEKSLPQKREAEAELVLYQSLQCQSHRLSKSTVSTSL